MHPFAHTALLAIVVMSALGALLMCVLVLQYGFPPLRDEDRGKREGERRLVMTRLGHAAAGACFAVAALLAVVALALPSRPATPVPSSTRADAEIDRLRQELRGMEGRFGRVESQIGAAESRAAAAESRMNGVEARVANLASGVTDTESRVADAEAAARRAGTEAGRALASVRQLERAATVEPPRAPATRRVGSSVTPPRRPEARAEPAPAAASPRTAASTPPPPPLVVQPARPRPANPVATAEPAAEPERSLGDKVRDDWKKIKRETQAAGEDVRSAFRRLRDWLTP